MPIKGQIIGKHKVVSVTYRGNSRNYEDEPWKNWSVLLNPATKESIASTAADETDDSPVATRKKRRPPAKSTPTKSPRPTSGNMIVLYGYLVFMSCMHVLCACLV